MGQTWFVAGIKKIVKFFVSNRTLKSTATVCHTTSNGVDIFERPWHQQFWHKRFVTIENGNFYGGLVKDWSGKF